MVLTRAALDERSARVQLRGQIAGLERQLAAYPPARPPQIVSARPRLLTLGELERVRDALAHRLAAARLAQCACVERQAAARALLEQMLVEPGRHKFVRVARREVGEPGCGAWHVRPRLGLIGMLMGWWQVKLSSGCPLRVPKAVT